MGHSPNYNVELSWNNGRIVFYVNLEKDSNDKYILKSQAEIVLNGVIVENNNEYIEVK